MNADGSNPVNISKHPSSDVFPAWSPDGSMIAFSTNRHAEDEHDFRYDIYIMDADGGNQTRLTDTPGYDTSPSWRPVK